MPENVPNPSINWKKVIITVVVIALLTAFIAVLAWFYVEHQTKNIENSASNSSSATGSNKEATKSATPSASTSNWTLFSDTVGDFSFKYPSGWVKVDEYDNSKEAKAIAGEILARSITFEKSINNEMVGMFMIHVANNPSSLSLKEFYDSHPVYFESETLQSKTDLTLGGKETYMTINYNQPQAYDEVSYIVAAANKKVYIFIASRVTGVKNPVGMAEYKNIFSTAAFQ